MIKMRMLLRVQLRIKITQKEGPDIKSISVSEYRLTKIRGEGLTYRLLRSCEHL